MKTQWITIFVLVMLTSAGQTFAQSTAFTYHGRLNNNGSPVTGLYDLQFTVFDSSGGATVVAALPPVSGVGITNGLFTTRLDFGAGVFTGPARWLEIRVRPTGGGNFQTLSPRQELTSSPYAIRAQTAGTATDVSNGSVVKSLNNLRDNVVLAEGANVRIERSGNTLTVNSSGSGAFSLNGNNAFYNAGNVGIGTSTPANKLTVLTPTLGYGVEHTDGDTRLSTFVGRGSGWLGTLSNHKLTLFANDNGFQNMTATLDTTGNFGIGTDSPILKLHVEGDQFLSGNAYFGERGRQMFNLFGTGFGIGIQTATVYSRSGGGFAWFWGGNHTDTTYDSGGGTTLMTLDAARGLDFGSRLGQHINLWGSLSPRSFGFGIQGETIYMRTGRDGGDGFAWYKGGVHNDGHRNPGGGKTLMTLDEETGLFVDGLASVRVLTIRGGADLAEPFPMEETIEKGSVVVIDKDNPGRLQRSTQAYDKRVAGIVSGANGVSPGIALKQEGVLDQGQNVALSGRVYVLADSTHGEIEPGDLLTTSDTPGYAMKVSDHAKAQGAILGKAMSPLKSSKGMVLVLVTLQ